MIVVPVPSCPLPDVLDGSVLPAAELDAARLDGEVVRIGDAFLPVDVPETAERRARALPFGHHERLIAELHSAAWVWGVLPSAPCPPRFAVAIDARIGRVLSGAVIVREVVIEPGDVVEVAGLPVMAPLRTALDLLRLDRFGEAERRAVAALAVLAGAGADALAQGVERRRNLPHKRRALERLVSTQPLLTR